MILWFVIILYKFFHDANLSIFILHGLKQFKTYFFFFKTHIYQFFDKSQNDLKPSYIFILRGEILGYSLKATGTSSGCVYNVSIFFFTKPAIIYSFLSSPTYRRPYRAIKAETGIQSLYAVLKIWYLRGLCIATDIESSLVRFYTKFCVRF